MYVFVYCLVLFMGQAWSFNAEISDNQYMLMPELFYLDNFDQCMLEGKQALFCTFTFTLRPVSENYSSIIWDIIRNVSAQPQRYRHDELRHGICVTKTCLSEYNEYATIKEVVENCYNEKYDQIGLEGTVTNLTCQDGGSNYRMDVYDIVFGVVVATYVIFVVFASFYERYVSRPSKRHLYGTTANQVSLYIAAFSVPRNWHRLRSTNSSVDHRRLRSMQGIRFYNMIAVITAHAVMAQLGGPLSNPQYLENSTKKVLNMFLANGWHAVQAFFVISGWLLSYHFFDLTADPKKKFNASYLCWAILNRYIRLMPGMAFMVGFDATWLAHLSKGPYWDTFVGEEYRNCRKNWWTNLLFINNYVDNKNMCLQQTWYIAADMQLFVFSTVVLYVIWKFPKKLWLVFGTILLVGFLAPGVIAFVKNHDIIVRQYAEAIYNFNLVKLDIWHDLYSSAYCNVFGYTIGMVFGYLFFRYRYTCLPIRTIHICLWWLLTFGMCTLIVTIAVVFYDPNFPVTPVKSALYWSCGKNFFAFGIAVGIFGMTQKIGWFARWCCEFRPLRVLGRLTYSAYIVHVALLRYDAGYRRYPVSGNDTVLLTSVLGTLTFSYLLATLLCLLVEMPVSALQKVLGLTVNRSKSAVIKSSEKSLETIDMTSDNANNV